MSRKVFFKNYCICVFIKKNCFRHDPNSGLQTDKYPHINIPADFFPPLHPPALPDVKTALQDHGKVYSVSGIFL